MKNVLSTVISQYANSPTIMQLVKNMDQYIDPSADFQKFYDFVWNVDTSQGFGLDIWGRIVNISRYLTVTESQKYFGFDAGNGYYPFDEGIFNPGESVTSTYELADDAYRKLILVKALANISATNSRSINQLLQNMFADRGRCYVNDLGNMSMRYTFEFYLEPYEMAILEQSGALPKPAGVSFSILQVELPYTFGFNEAGAASAAPFGQGVFI